jgi:hypothetical protein
MILDHDGNNIRIFEKINFFAIYQANYCGNALARHTSVIPFVIPITLSQPYIKMSRQNYGQIAEVFGQIGTR